MLFARFWAYSLSVTVTEGCCSGSAVVRAVETPAAPALCAAGAFTDAAVPVPEG
ncbi:hypothetical protein [Pseudomonas sp. OHS18]|uniref:hypothetical protein n=1 Tax=Pseudomonas sp. OHS18 TaxID=3399679 RepID=UPI003A89337C